MSVSPKQFASLDYERNVFPHHFNIVEKSYPAATLSTLLVSTHLQPLTGGIQPGALQQIDPASSSIQLSGAPTLSSPRLAGRAKQAKVAAAKADIEANIASALDLYEIDNGKYPAGLEDLMKQNVELPRAYRHPSRQIAFFYMPSPLQEGEPTSKLLACDWVDNQTGNVRVVLYVNRVIDMTGVGKFQELLAREENKAFAAALKEAEKKLLPDK